MYQALLTRKYLTSKIMPLLAMVAVTLSVATVLITWSVMGGFLKTLISGGRTMIGDVALAWPNVGFAHYEDLIDRLEADPQILAAAPVIETFGLVTLPSGRVEDVAIKGIEPESFDAVTGFMSTIWWKPLDEPVLKDTQRIDPRLIEEDRAVLGRIERQGRELRRADPQTGRPEIAALIGIELTGLNRRQQSGVYLPMQPLRATSSGAVTYDSVFMALNGAIRITVPGFDTQGQVIDFSTERFPVANEFQTGVYEIDSKTVLVPLSALQELLHMDEAKRVARSDPFEEFDGGPGPEVVGIDPARVTTVLVRAVDGVDVDAVKAICDRVYADFSRAHEGEVPLPLDMRPRSWEDLNATLIGAVKKETGLVLFIFGVISFTTVFLVLAIFWSMVSEKTRDIGVLRALGASTLGVAWLWLRYGAAIGLVGAVAGVFVGWLIVTNINPIHDWLGADLGPGLSRAASAVLGWFGAGPVTIDLTIWDPRVYYFVEIPREVEPGKAAVVFVVGILTCLLGALIPATRAARMDPVRALRFE